MFIFRISRDRDVITQVLCELFLLSTNAELNFNKISFKKEGLPSCSVLIVFVRHLGTFVNALVTIGTQYVHYQTLMTHHTVVLTFITLTCFRNTSVFNVR